MIRFAAVLISLVMCSVAVGQQNTFDVRRFGATTDDATDDTTAIQAAIDAATAASPARVEFPRGTYLVGSLTVAATAADVTLEGPGAVLQRNGTGILLLVRGDRCKVRFLEFDGVDYNDANTALIQIAGVSSPLNEAEDNLIEHCYLHDTFDADSGANGTVAADGIQVLQAVQRTTLRFCHSHECGGNAFRFTGFDQRVEYCTATEYHNRGFRGYGGTRLWMVGCYAETTQDVYNGGAPCLIDPQGDGLEECYITGCFFWINRNQNPDVGTQALKLAHIEKSVVTDTTCKATWSEGTTHRAVRLEDCLRSVTFRGCRIRGNLFFTETGHGGISSQADDGGFVQFTLSGERRLIDPDDDEDLSQEVYIHNTGIAAYNRVHATTDIGSVTDNGLGVTPRYEFTVTTDIPYTAGSITTATAFWRSTPDKVTFEDCEFGDEEYEAAAAANGDANRQVAIENLNARITKIRDCTFRMDGTSPAIEWAVDNDAYFERLEMVNNEFTWDRSGTCIAMSMEDPTHSLITSGKVIASDNRMVNAGSGSTQIVKLSNSIESGTCGSGSTTTAINLGEAASGTEIFEGKVLTISGESRRITDWNQGTTTATVGSAFGGAPSAPTAWSMFDTTYNDRTLLFSTDGSNSKRFVTTTGTVPLETATDTLGVLTFASGDVILNSPNNATKPLAWVYTTGGWLSYGAKPMQTIINSSNTPYTFDKSNHDMTFRINDTNCLVNLPAVTTSPSGALAGLRIRIVVIEGGMGSSNANADTGDAFEIDPNGSEIIVLPGATNSAGKKLRLDGDTDRAGDAVILEAGTDRWYVTSVNGTWSKEP